VQEVIIHSERQARDVGDEIGLRVVIALRVCSGVGDKAGEKKENSGEGFRVHLPFLILKDSTT
jgi:hypothetical protein